MKTKTPLLLAIATVLSSGPAAAETDGVAACRLKTDDADRLACYDTLFGKAVQTADVVPEPIAEPAPSKAVDEFGSEQLPDLEDDEIRARLVGTFNGWDGSTRFHLDNGQVWRQLKNNARPWTPREPIEAPMVTIEKTMLGYKLQVEGVKRTVQVKRVK